VVIRAVIQYSILDCNENSKSDEHGLGPTKLSKTKSVTILTKLNGYLIHSEFNVKSIHSTVNSTAAPCSNL